MPSPKFEIPSGVIDGANTDFTVSLPYLTGSTAVFINGILVKKVDDDGWTETDPSTGLITLKEAPVATGPSPEIVQVFYLDASGASLPEGQIQSFIGTLTLNRGSTIRSAMVSAPIRGKLDYSIDTIGATSIDHRISAKVFSYDQILGKIEVCS